MAPEDQEISLHAQYGLIVNPLENIDETDLLRNVYTFYKSKEDLGKVLDYLLLVRGALLAQGQGGIRERIPDRQSEIRTEHPSASEGHSADAEPHEYRLSEKDREFTPDEAAALRNERSAALGTLTKDLVVILATCAVGAILQGWIQQSIVGANLDWPFDLHIKDHHSDHQADTYIQNGSIYFGLVNAMPYFAASVLGAWVSDPITYIYGRRTALFFAAICSLTGSIGAAYTQTWQQLLVCRLIQGVGVGAKASVVPILESEVSPFRMRGRLLVSWQTFVAVGITLGASANCIFQGHWRWQIGIAFVPAIPLLCLCYVIPESPRWLMRTGNYGQAYLVFQKIRPTPLQAARDFYLVYAQLQLETLLYSGTRITSSDLSAHLRTHAKKEDSKENLWRFFSRVPELFTQKRNRRAVIASSVVMIAQQFSGVNIFAFLATSVLGDSALQPKKSLYMTLGFAISNAVFSPTAYWLIDRLGRRTLLLTSLILMIPFLLLTGYFLDVGNKTGAVVALVIIYTAIYSPGAGVIPFMYSSEVFPQVYREVGMSFACAVNFSFAGALAMVVPQYTADINNGRHFRLLGSFAGLDAFAVILVWLFMRSPDDPVELEDMNFLFGARSMDYIWYQTTQVTPAFFARIFCLRADPERRTSFARWQWDRMTKTRDVSLGHLEPQNTI